VSTDKEYPGRTELSIAFLLILPGNMTRFPLFHLECGKYKMFLIDVRVRKAENLTETF
jgi:hypothetical protein